MHTDESINAYIIGQLLAGQPFHYDPQDRHGPALAAVTLPLVKLEGAKNFSGLTESQCAPFPGPGRNRHGSASGRGRGIIWLRCLFRRRAAVCVCALAGLLQPLFHPRKLVCGRDPGIDFIRRADGAGQISFIRRGRWPDFAARSCSRAKETATALLHYAVSPGPGRIVECGDMSPLQRKLWVFQRGKSF